MNTGIKIIIIVLIIISGLTGYINGHQSGYNKRSVEFQPQIDDLCHKVFTVLPRKMYISLIRGENQLVYEGTAFCLFIEDYPFLYQTVIESYRQYKDSLHNAGWGHIRKYMSFTPIISRR